MSKEIGDFLGQQIGRVLEVDTGVSRGCLGKYLRIRIQIDVRKPLKRFLRVDILGDGTETIMPLKYKRLPEFCFCCGLIGHPLREFMDTDQDDIMTGSMALRFGGWLWAESPPRVNTRPSANDSTRAAKQWPGGNNECVSEAGRGAADSPRAVSCAGKETSGHAEQTLPPIQSGAYIEQGSCDMALASLENVGQGSGTVVGLGSTKELHKVSPITTKVNPPVSSLFIFGSLDLNDECLGDSGLGTT
ncbi:hypothetical protein ACOSQ2_031048 [Xanthoceras sorbifolium]